MSIELNYSPKLKSAMEEIKEIIKKYDIAACVVLHTAWHEPALESIDGRSEYLNSISPSYSCATMEDGGVHFFAKADMYEGGAAERDIKLACTANMLTHFMDVLGQTFLMYSDISRQLEKAAGPFEHK